MWGVMFDGRHHFASELRRLLPLTVGRLDIFAQKSNTKFYMKIPFVASVELEFSHLRHAPVQTANRRFREARELELKCNTYPPLHSAMTIV